ncbi:MAG: M20 metallopeptidase family protein, partial [Steroidobacteraceae bacterium]
DAEIDRRASALEARMIEWRRDIHQHPELGFQEVRTSKRVAEHLRKLGYEVRTGLAGGTGVIALLKGGKPGPVVGLRAEMDALPIKEETRVPFASTTTSKWGSSVTPVMHACGHDAHTAILMAAAEVFSQMRAHLPGTIMLIFQPAEESGPPGSKEQSGAAYLVREGDLANPKPAVIYGLHLLAGTRGTTGKLYIGKGSISYGLSQFQITIKGKGAHANKPWEGADTVVAAAQTIMALQTVISRNVNVYRNQATLSIGGFHGAEGFNVLPESVVLEGALRLTDATQRIPLQKRIEDVAHGTAESAGVTTAVEWLMWNPPLDNDPTLTEQARASLLKAAAAPADVVPIVFEDNGVDDFAFFNAIAPTFFYMIGAGRDADDPAPQAGHHNPLFYANERALIVGLRATLHLSFDYMAAHPGL